MDKYLKHFTRRWTAENSANSRNRDDLNALGFGHIAGGLMVYAVGVFSAVVVFAGESIARKRTEMSRGKKVFKMYD